MGSWQHQDPGYICANHPTVEQITTDYGSCWWVLTTKSSWGYWCHVLTFGESLAWTTRREMGWERGRDDWATLDSFLCPNFFSSQNTWQKLAGLALTDPCKSCLGYREPICCVVITSPILLLANTKYLRRFDSQECWSPAWLSWDIPGHYRRHQIEADTKCW